MIKLSLFSGVLGDDLASEWAGIKTVCCVENDPFCQKIIRKHYPDMPIIGDIHDVTKAKLKEVSGYEWVDIVAGGDPCQPRSIAGKRRGKADDRDLWSEMFRVICELKPTWVVNENPAGRLSMDFHEVLSDLESQGYETRSFVIPACAVNAPHRRDRLFIVAYRARKQNDPTNERELYSQSSLSSELVANTNDAKATRQREHRRGILREPESERPYIPDSQSASNSNTEGLQGFGEFGERARELIVAQSAWQESWIEVAATFCRMDDGFSNRVARLKALGNACVPQQAYSIYRAIVEVEKLLHSRGCPAERRVNIKPRDGFMTGGGTCHLASE